MLTPKIVAQHYLGNPIKKTGDRLWYKSPFRNERTASFMVDDTAFHDFGDSWHGDIIDFVGRYYNTDFGTAMKILSKNFGLPKSETISKEVEEYLKKRQSEDKLIKEKINEWFYKKLGELCDDLRQYKEIQTYVSGDALKIVYNEISRLEYLTEVFTNATEKEKIELWKYERGE